MSSGDFNATITATPPITIDQFYPTPPSTPGNVGICLSGGGSRALTAGMGQLQALSYLNLLGSVKAISTVSGGSWLGVAFEFLPADGPSDSAYLGTYQTDPGSITVDDLGVLPDGNAGNPLDTGFFSPEFLALEAFILWSMLDVPANMLWQTIIGLNILANYNLYQPDTDLAPTDMFSYDQTTLGQITAANSALQPETAYLFADAESGNRTRRPFLICNMGMFMNETDTDVKLLAPVQSTAFLTGILGTPGGTDANGLKPGGGGITSFAFNSNFVSADGTSVVVNQTRQWSVTDAVGTSSAFFADEIANLLATWENDLDKFRKTLWKELDHIWEWIESHLSLEAQLKAKPQVHALVARSTEAFPFDIEFPGLKDLIPLYYYWPPSETSPTQNPQPSQFADGGSLENTGVCGMLIYNDIESIVSFVNSEQPIVRGHYGVSDGKGGFLDGTKVIVDDSIPPLFGYQPYDKHGGGYVLYEGFSDPIYFQFAHNQVFDSSEFPTLLKALWANSGSSVTARATSPAIASQSLTVLANRWFGIAGGQTVTVVWCHLNYAQNWVDLFTAPVPDLIAREVQNSSFPNYKTVDTDLTATQTNLISMIAAWSVVSAEQASKIFSGLFPPAPKSLASSA
jgi:hypothetical protein